MEVENQLNELFDLRDRMTKGKADVDEVAEAIQVVLGLIKQIKDDLEQEMASNKDKMDAEHEEMLSDMKAMEERMKAMCDKMSQKQGVDIESVTKQIKDIVNDLENLRGQIPPEVDLSDIWTKLSDLEAKIPKIPDEITPYQVRDKLESIEKEEEKLRIEAIKDLKERLEALEKRPVGRGGGGTSAVGVAHAFKYIAHTEQPVGAIDGANTTYTVKNTIWWIAGFTLNGEQIAQLPNFTYANRTITFSSALPAAYSGKDFEIKYIGT